MYLLEGKKQWTQDRIDEASNETINKTYARCKQRKLNKKGGKTGKVLGKHAIGMYFTGISQVVKIRDVKELQQEIQSSKPNDPIIKTKWLKEVSI